MQTREMLREAYLAAADDAGRVPGVRFRQIRAGHRHPDTSRVRDLETMKRRRTDFADAASFLDRVHDAERAALMKLWHVTPNPERVA